MRRVAHASYNVHSAETCRKHWRQECCSAGPTRIVKKMSIDQQPHRSERAHQPVTSPYLLRSDLCSFVARTNRSKTKCAGVTLCASVVQSFNNQPQSHRGAESGELDDRVGERSVLGDGAVGCVAEPCATLSGPFQGRILAGEGVPRVRLRDPGLGCQTPSGPLLGRIPLAVQSTAD
jgi:hypothetical protein